MPNRILKESICASDNLNNLTPQEEIMFYRLLVTCDDYGRLDARPTILRSKCFPLKVDTIKNTDILEWLAALEKHQLLSQYSVNGGTYLQILTWESHQQVRAKRSKYPSPDNIGNQLQANDINCKQMSSLSLSLSLSLSNIYTLWNKQKIITHKKLTEEIKGSINTALKNYSEEDISRAIKNYGLIVNSDEYYWTYSWTLKDFLKRGIEKFLDLEVAKKNYREKNGAHKQDISKTPTRYTKPEELLQ